MKIDLRLPAGWTEVATDGGGYRATSAQLPSLAIETAPLIVREDNLIGWSRRIMCQQLGTDDAGLQLEVDDRGTTHDGWPTWFVVAKAAARPGDTRAFAFYHFLDYATFASIRGPGAAAHLDLLRGARPDYTSDTVVAIEELWQ